MDENSDRDSVIALLEKLGDEKDETVLEAGRALHAKISEMGVGWDDLLVPDDDAAQDAVDEYDYDDDDEDEDDDSDEESPAPDEADFEPVGDAADDIKLIDRLLATKDISAEFREELDGYKEDIKEGEFGAADRNYLQAVQRRLSGNKKQSKSGR